MRFWGAGGSVDSKLWNITGARKKGGESSCVMAACN